MFSKKTTLFSAQPICYITYLSLMLLNLLVNNIPISFEGPLNFICKQVSIKVNVVLELEL